MSSTIKGLPPRIQIRRWDDQQGSYPNSKRQDIFENYSANVFFDDSKTLNFGSYNDIHFPNALISGSYYDDNLGSNIVARGNQRSGVSDSRVFPSLQTQAFRPFDETRVISGDSDSVMTGTLSSGLPGWSARLGSKFAITIDVTSRESKIIHRCPGYLYSPIANNPPTSSGFCYFNFDERRWEDIGLTDPLTGVDLLFDPNLYVSGNIYTGYDTLQYISSMSITHFNYPTQFVGGHGFTNSTNLFYQKQNGQYFAAGLNPSILSKIGAPTDSFGAPNSPKYHATSSQRFSLSEVLGFPFAIEKIQYKIPIVVRREDNYEIYGIIDGDFGDTPAFTRMGLLERPFDVYSFFTYRQRNSQGSKRQQVSGSHRVLISSATLCAYNSPTLKYYENYLEIMAPITFNTSYDMIVSASQILTDEETIRYRPNPTSFTSYYDFNKRVLIPTGSEEFSTLVGPSSASLTVDLVSPVALSNPAYQTAQTMFTVYNAPTIPYDPGAIYVDFIYNIGGFNGANGLTVDVECLWPGTTPSPYSGPDPLRYDNSTNFAFPSWKPTQYVGLYTTSSGTDASPGATFQAAIDTSTLPERIQDTRFFIGSSPAGRINTTTASIDPVEAFLYGSKLSLERSLVRPVVESPYVVFPGDDLVFGIDSLVTNITGQGFVNQTNKIGALVSTTTGSNIYEISAAGSHIEITTGSASITLYGSILRENKPIEYSLNQVLTSNSIHESLHSDNPVVDQFDIEPLGDYSGSYIAEIFRGDILPGDGFINGKDKNRKAFYSAFDASRSPSRFGISGPDGATGTDLYYQPYDLVSGSFLRAVRISSEERVWDSVTPDPVDYLRSAFDITVGSTGSYVDFYDFSGSLREPTVGYEGSWYNSGTYRARYFPFEAGLERGKSSNPKRGTEAVIFGSSLLGSTATGYSDEYKRIIAFSRGWDLRYTSTQGTPIAFSPWQGARALRYGLSNYRAQFTAAHFRRDHHGFVRDMLEQRPFTAFQTFGGFTDPAVSAIFVSASSETQVDPLLTNCSNVSAHATSSVPYFDGQFRNRLSFPTASLLPEFKPTLILG
jgi:hypothetical protein